MTIRRMLFVALAVAVATGAFVVFDIMRTSVPASTSEIHSAIRDARPACRALVQERLRASIVRNGAVSRRQVDTISHMECTVAGPQYEAAGG